MTYKQLYEKYGEIKIKCEAKDNLPLDAIMDFQGSLKKRSKASKIKLATLMFKQGFIAPFFIWQDKDNYYNLDGHGRSEVLCEIRKAGIPIPAMFPVAYIHADNETEAKEILLSISSQFGDFDEDELSEWLDNIDEDIQESLRFLDKEIKIDNIIETENDDEIPEVKEAITKPGDLWELGNHRLLCGDGTKEIQINKLINKKNINMIFTDPPYDIKIDNNIINKYIDNGNIFIFNNDRNTVNYLKKSNNRFIKYFIFHHGGVAIPQNGGKEPFLRHILILHEVRGKAIKLQTKEGLSSIIKSKYRHEKEMHKYLKPIESLIPIIKGYSLKKDIILDLFIGSGSTLIACEKTDRICYGMEIDPHYCDVIINRYINWCKANKREYNIKRNGKECQQPH